MYIARPENEREKEDKKKRMNSFIEKEVRKPEETQPKIEEKERPEPVIESRLDSINPKKILFRWRAPEFETYEKDRKWYLIVSLVLLAIVGYAIYTNSPVMAITFILIGVLGYIYVGKEPRILDFAITLDGVIAGNEIFEFDNMKSFWIFYEPPYQKTLSLRTKSSLMPFVHIPIHDQNPVEIREHLLDFVPEEKQEAGLVDTFERIFHI